MRKINSGFSGKRVLVEVGYYGDYKEFPLYDMKGLSVDEISSDLFSYYIDDGPGSLGDDGNYYVIIDSAQDRYDQIAINEDQLNEYMSAIESEDYDHIIK